MIGPVPSLHENALRLSLELRLDERPWVRVAMNSSLAEFSWFNGQGAGVVPTAGASEPPFGALDQKVFDGSCGCSGGGAAPLVSNDGGGGPFGSGGAVGGSVTAFSTGGSAFGLSYSSPGSGRACLVTAGGALFTGTTAPL